MANERICVIIGRSRHKMMIVELQEAIKQGAALIEVRLDFLARAIDYRRLWEYKQCPWIATIRRKEDGGRFAGSEDDRKTLIRQAIVQGFDWIDLETDVADAIPRFRQVKRIVSYHNLDETPADLEDIYAKMETQDADVLKLAVNANKPTDMLRVLNLIRNAKKPTIGHCMGDMGFPSRILSLALGSPFTYAAFNKERGIAPGLPSFEELKRHYSLDMLNRDTQLFGVIGDPVAHSFSPLLHNALFRAYKINAVYLPFRVPRGELKATVEGFASYPASGYSVTIPHKEGAAALATTHDERVTETHAANTLVRTDTGYAASNTDYQAALESILAHPPLREDGSPRPLTECTALILGAGGAARAIAHALHKAGCPIQIAGRTIEKAKALAHEVNGRAWDWEARHNVKADVIVNCTPIGMHPQMDESPLHHSYLTPGMLIFDTIYNPENTLLLKEARVRGCQTVSGLEMFVRQAALQFDLFTGKKPDLEKLRGFMRRALSPVRDEAAPE